MSDMSVSDDPMKALTRNKNEQVSLYDSGLYVCLPVHRVERIIQDIGVDMPPPMISQILHMGHKIKSTSMVSYDCEIVESYEFKRHVIFYIVISPTI